MIPDFSRMDWHKPAAIGAATGKAKDKDYLAKLGTLTLPKLLDLARTARA